MQDCIFCKILRGEIASQKIYEDDDFFVIKDIDPKCKNHFLAIPKKHYALLSQMDKDDTAALGRIFSKIPKLCDKLFLDGGYRLVVNQGDNAGQSVHHLHIHILSGQKMTWTPA